MQAVGRAAHSDVGPGPFIDWVRYSLWGRPCVMSQRSRGMLPRIYDDRARCLWCLFACRQQHGDKRRMRCEMGPRTTLVASVSAGLRARSLVQCAAFATLGGSCESGNYQLTFLHRLTLFETVRSAKKTWQRAIASHDTRIQRLEASQPVQESDRQQQPRELLVSPFHRCCTLPSARNHPQIAPNKPPAARAETTWISISQHRSAIRPLIYTSIATDTATATATAASTAARHLLASHSRTHRP